MWLDRPPARLDASVFSRMPDEFRREGQRSAWADANKGGHAVASFIEGPAFDAQGRLYVVDIPFGRIFRISPDGRTWEPIIEYDGWPNGLKIHPDGRILIADHRRGLLVLDADRGEVRPLLATRNSEAFKGLNDLTIASDGDVFFTDQGQTGLHDPSGRVYRLRTDGRLECLLDNCPSPNGLALDLTETVLFVAMTRDNSVWRCPLPASGGTAKVGRFCTLFGTSGPDGLATDSAGNLVVAHASLGAAFVFAPNGELRARVVSPQGTTCTNVAFGGEDRHSLFITESSTGTILAARMPDAGLVLPRGTIVPPC